MGDEPNAELPPPEFYEPPIETGEPAELKYFESKYDLFKSILQIGGKDELLKREDVLGNLTRPESKAIIPYYVLAYDLKYMGLPEAAQIFLDDARVRMAVSRSIEALQQTLFIVGEKKEREMHQYIHATPEQQPPPKRRGFFGFGGRE